MICPQLRTLVSYLKIIEKVSLNDRLQRKHITMILDGYKCYEENEIRQHDKQRQGITLDMKVKDSLFEKVVPKYPPE